MRTLTATSLMSLLGKCVCSAWLVPLRCTFSGRQMSAGTLSAGSYFSLTSCLYFWYSNHANCFDWDATHGGTSRTKSAPRGVDAGKRPEDQDPRRSQKLSDIVGLVEFDDVSFSYDAAHEVLHDVSFRSEPGTVTALVGSSGSGESTTIGLISAFYTPTKGMIRVDDIDLSTVRLDSFRTRLGVVLQEWFLFDGTIRDNVAFSAPTHRKKGIMRPAA